jgi:hypothetical protein
MLLLYFNVEVRRQRQSNSHHSGGTKTSDRSNHDTRHSEHRITHKDVSVPHKTLGCFKSIIGNDEAEVEYVKHNSDGYGNLVKNSPLNHRQGALAYHLVYISSLKYGLPSASLSWSQIDQIHKYAVDKFLSVMGYDHSTHRALVYRPAEFGGLGVRHLYTETLGMKIDTVMSHIRAQSDLGTSFIININYIQLLSGLET